MDKMKHIKAIENIPEEYLVFNEGDFCGLDATIVFPCKGNYVEWTQENKFARSIVIDSDNSTLLSAGFPKFVNLGENPLNFPPPEDITDAYVMEKIDGSLCIMDCVNGHLNMRTRGTLTYKTLENAKDFEIALEKHPLIAPWLQNHQHMSLLFEIVTPNNRIVIDYPDIDLYLIGAIDKRSYNLENQYNLDCYAEEMHAKRPDRYTFTNLNDCVNTIRKIKGKEGVCLYMADGEIFKIKGEEYLKLHSFKSNATIKNLLNLCEELRWPTIDDLKEYVLREFDWECWKYAEDNVKEIYAKKHEIDCNIMTMGEYCNEHISDSQRQFAEHNIRHNSREDSKLAFLIRAGKEIPAILIRKMIERRMENV